MELTVGYIEESLLIPAMEKVYEEFRSYLQRTLKMPVRNIGISMEEATKFESNRSLETDVDIFFVTMDLSLFEDSRYYTPSYIYAYSDTSIISANPMPSIHKSLTIFLIETSFALAMALCLFVVSLVIMIIKYFHSHVITASNEGENMNWKKWLKLFFLRLGGKMWFFSNTFLFQAIPKIPRTLSARLLCAGWLLSFQIINIYLCCYLRSDLSVIVYRTVDSILDLKYYPDAKPVMVKDGLEERYLKRMSPAKPEYKKFLKTFHENSHYITVDEFLNGDFYGKIANKEEILIFNIKLWKIFANEGLKGAPKVNIYIGKDIMKRDPLVLPVKRSLPIGLRENITMKISRIFDSYAYRYLEIEDDYRVLWHSWEPPPNEFTAASIDDVMAGILLLAAGYLVSIGISMIKLIIHLSTSSTKPRYGQKLTRPHRKEENNFLEKCFALDVWK